MPLRPCPNCGRQGTWLEASSQNSDVDYFRCPTPGCGHVWCIDKNNPSAPPRDVSQPAAQRRDYIF